MLEKKEKDIIKLLRLNSRSQLTKIGKQTSASEQDALVLEFPTGRIDLFRCQTLLKRFDCAAI